MPLALDLSIDERSKIMTFTYSGRADDLVEFVALAGRALEGRTELPADYNLLVDMRAVERAPELDTRYTAVENYSEQVAPQTAQRIAYLVHDELAYGTLRMFQVAREGADVAARRTFIDPVEALDWLREAP